MWHYSYGEYDSTHMIYVILYAFYDCVEYMYMDKMHRCDMNYMIDKMNRYYMNYMIERREIDAIWTIWLKKMNRHEMMYMNDRDIWMYYDVHEW